MLQHEASIGEMLKQSAEKKTRGLLICQENVFIFTCPLITMGIFVNCARHLVLLSDIRHLSFRMLRKRLVHIMAFNSSAAWDALVFSQLTPTKRGIKSQGGTFVRHDTTLNEYVDLI